MLFATQDFLTGNLLCFMLFKIAGKTNQDKGQIVPSAWRRAGPSSAARLGFSFFYSSMFG